MKHIGMVILFGLLAACGGGGGGGLEDLKNKVCGCKDMECVGKYADEIEKLESRFENKEPTVDERKLGDQIEICMQQALRGK